MARRHVSILLLTIILFFSTILQSPFALPVAAQTEATQGEPDMSTVETSIAPSLAQAQAQLKDETIQAAATDVDSQNVRLLGHLGGTTNVVYVVGNLAYIGEGSYLTIIDISNPAKPLVLGKTQPMPEIVQDIFVLDNFAYVADGGSGLRVMNISNSTAPVEVGFYDTQGTALNVHVVGNMAYVADWIGGLRLLDVTNPSAPVEIGFYATKKTVGDIYVVGSMAYVLDWHSGLRVLDVANPSAPVEVGVYDTIYSETSVFVVDSTVYLTVTDVPPPGDPRDEADELLIINMANPASPVVVGAYGSFYPSGIVVNIFVVGSTAYVTSGGSVSIVNVANPAAPVEVGFYHTPVSVRDIYAVSGMAYIVDWYGRVRILNVTNPTNPVEVGSYDDMLSDASGISVVGNFAYIADGGNGLRVVNVTNPAAPTTVGFYDTPGEAICLYVVGNMAYVADGTGGLRLVDVTDPTTPVEVGFYDTPGAAYGVFVVGSMAYVADGNAGLRLVNVANPAAPIEVGFYNIPGSAEDVYVVGSAAYVAASGAGLRVINVANPASPIEVGFYDTPGSASIVHVAGNLAYVADGESGLRIVNVASPSAPTEVGFYDTPGQAFGVSVVGSIAYLADLNRGLRVVNVANPAAPIELGFFDTSGVAVIVKGVGNTAYVADRSGGLAIFRYPDCYRLTLQVAGNGASPLTFPPNSNGCNPREYLPGTFVTVSAVPANNWRIAGWVGTGNDNTTSKNNTLTMPAIDHEVTVNYAPICYKFTITQEGTGGGVTTDPPNTPACPLGQFGAGEVIRLRAIPGAGWRVADWSGTDNNASSSTDNTLIMPASDAAVSVRYAEIPTPPAQSARTDSYEPDDDCGEAKSINSAGVTQEHDFHKASEVDWIKFDPLVGVRYRVEVTGDATEAGNMEVALLTQCSGTPSQQNKPALSPGIQLDVPTATVASPVYIRLTNLRPEVSDEAATYQVSVRALAPISATNTRVLVLVAGAKSHPDALQTRIDNVTKQVYSYYRSIGYGDADIFYLGDSADLPGRDAPATLAALQQVLTLSAPQRLKEGGSLTLYLVDHGNHDQFHLNQITSQTLNPQQLDNWLDGVEDTIRNLQVTLIIEACYSGSFISGEQSASKNDSPNKRPRLVLTSADDSTNAYVSDTGAYFSDYLLRDLGLGYSLVNSFHTAKTAATQIAASYEKRQQPWVDSNGNGIPNEEADLLFSSASEADPPGASSKTAPAIVVVTVTHKSSDNSVQLTTQAWDDQQIQRVWAVLYPPSYRPAETNGQLVEQALPKIELTREVTATAAQQGIAIFSTLSNEFKEIGGYRLLFYVEDNKGLRSLPKEAKLEVGGRVFLPLVVR